MLAYERGEFDAALSLSDKLIELTESEFGAEILTETPIASNDGRLGCDVS